MGGREKMKSQKIVTRELQFLYTTQTDIDNGIQRTLKHIYNKTIFHKKNINIPQFRSERVPFSCVVSYDYFCFYLKKNRSHARAKNKIKKVEGIFLILLQK